MNAMKLILAALAVLAIAGCATVGCAPPPKDLVIKDLERGSGDDAARFRTAVLVSYTGWLYDDCKPDHKGEKFDSSEGRTTPFGFMVGAGNVIKGWDEGLVGMKEHGVRRLVIPPDKAYGSQQKGPIIKPNSTLVFDVELLRILAHADEAPKK